MACCRGYSLQEVCERPLQLTFTPFPQASRGTITAPSAIAAMEAATVARAKTRMLFVTGGESIVEDILGRCHRYKQQTNDVDIFSVPVPMTFAYVKSPRWGMSKGVPGNASYLFKFTMSRSGLPKFRYPVVMSSLSRHSNCCREVVTANSDGSRHTEQNLYHPVASCC